MESIEHIYTDNFITEPEVEISLSLLRNSEIAAFKVTTISIETNDVFKQQRIYVDKNSQYFIIGNIYNLNTSIIKTLDNAPNIKGSNSAVVKIVEYTDMQCSYCAKAHKAIMQNIGRYGDKVSVELKHYPLNNHIWAKKAAEAAVCAGQQSKFGFWSLVDSIFSNQQDIEVNNLHAKLKKFTRRARLDRKDFQRCLEGGGGQATVKQNKADGITLGVRSTPTFFINGKQLNGFHSFDRIAVEIDKVLQ